MANLEPKRDVPNLSFVYFSDGGFAKLVRTDPFGFWSVHWHKGPTPEVLSGSYTTQSDASAAVIRFMNDGSYSRYARIVPEKVEKAEPVVYKRARKESVTA